MRCLKFHQRKESTWKFVFFSREPNQFVKKAKTIRKELIYKKCTRRLIKDCQDQQQNTKKWEKSAIKADNRVVEIMLKSYARRNADKNYKPGDKIFVRAGTKQRRFIKNYMILKGTNVKQYKGKY